MSVSFCFCVVEYEFKQKSCKSLSIYLPYNTTSKKKGNFQQERKEINNYRVPIIYQEANEQYVTESQHPAYHGNSNYLTLDNKLLYIYKLMIGQ